MDEEKNYSRVNKYDKRRKTTKSITILMIVAVVLVVLLIGLLVFGGKDDTDEETTPSEETTTEKNNREEDESTNEDQTEGDEETEDSEDPSDKQDADEDADDLVETETIPDEEIDDPNVIEAYTGNWKPVGTIQEEPHTTVFDKESDDWKEMMEAIAYALQIDEDDFVSHWVGNGGEQRVNAHVQSELTEEHYTVYLEWQENEGWQPTKVERVERFIHPDQAD